MTAEPHPPQPVAFHPSDAEEQLQTIFAAGRLGTWELQPGNKRRAVVLSPELETILGWGQGEFDGTVRTFLAQVHPGDRRRLLKELVKAVRRGTAPELEFRYLQPGQTNGWLLARGRTCRLAGERAERIAGVGIEVTRQKAAEQQWLGLRAELERRLEQSTQQLQAAQKELEAFCYSISHDLRAPLRSMRGFSEVLLERYAAQLDPRGQEFLRRACQASNHLEHLVEALLKLSRVGRAQMVRRKLDLSQLAREIAAELSAGDGSRQVRFEIAPGLQAEGDERLLRVALENLLSNAWKFTGGRTEALIQVGAEAGSAGVFFVSDNGAGFDPAYAERLFGTFQKLHSDKEFAGAGVGLAIVQRIIQRHGGRVWAVGEVDRGATFYFSIPST